jgi:two-component system cell cycle sensor histidine kinase/response regulator CckA
LTNHDPGEQGRERRSLERRQEDRALQESVERFRSLFESLDCVFLLDFEGRFVDANWTALELLGYEREELLSLSFSSLVDDDQLALALEVVAELKETGSQKTAAEFRVRRKTGEYVEVETKASVILRGGQPHAVLVVGRDITERKEAEKALKLARFSIDYSSDYTLWSGPDGRIIDVSESACSRLGYSRDELLAMSLFDITVDLSPDAWPDRWRELKEQGPLIFEKEYRAENGEIFPVEISSTIFEYEGKEYDLGIVRDITERKQAEEALRQSEEELRQSQKMEAVGQLAGGIAHDFNNLLTAILGYSDMILASGASSFDEVRADVEEIKLAGERASALTKQILAFSRRQALRPTMVSLNEVLAGMEPLLRRTLGENIDLASLKDPDLGYVEADVHQFEQVIMNLAVNARDAMASGGRLTLETANVELGAEYCRTHPEAVPGSYIVLSVSDTGVGMDEATCERVFEPFFTTKAPGAGTGLGLATVYGIVRQSNGSISVYSEPGQGTSFKVYLPLATRSEVPAEIVIPPCESARGSETVMVVEDEAALRSLIERILGGVGYATLAFGSAAEALKALERGECSVDILLTDVILSGAIQGDDLARAVRAARPELPILFMSGYPRDAIVHAGRLDEGVNFLEKPFTPEALARMVGQVLGQARPSAPRRRGAKS